MDAFDIRFRPQSLPIPREFFNSSTGGPFDRCMLCNTFLLAEGVNYVIEKACKRHLEFGIEDIVFEYAMCEKCAMQMSSAMSEESMGKISDYFQSQVDFAGRHRYLRQEQPPKLENWIGNCIVKGTPKEELTEYQVLGQFSGENMVMFMFPYMIGGEAMKEVSMLLSNETLGEIDNFMDNFGLPPELKDLWKDKPIMVF